MKKIIFTLLSALSISYASIAQEIDAQQALIEATTAKNFEAVKKVVEQLNGDVNKPYKNKAIGSPYALHVACNTFGPSIEIIQYLLDKGAKLDVENNFGMTPLTSLVSSYDTTNRLTIFNMLVEKGADINYVSKGGGSILGYASLYAQVEIVKLLINKVKDIDARKNVFAETPLMYAANSASDKRDIIVDLLLAAGADPKEERKVPQRDGTFAIKTAAKIAEEKGHTELAIKLKNAKKIKVKR